jgi:hypothetical protein
MHAENISSRNLNFGRHLGGYTGTDEKATKMREKTGFI